MQLFLDIDTRKILLPNGSTLASLKLSYPDKYPISLTVKSGKNTVPITGTCVLVMKKPNQPTSDTYSFTLLTFSNSHTASGDLDLFTQELDSLVPTSGYVQLFLEASLDYGFYQLTSLPVVATISRRFYVPGSPGPTASVSDRASQAEAELGADNTKWMSPVRAHDAIIAKLASSGITLL